MAHRLRFTTFRTAPYFQGTRTSGFGRMAFDAGRKSSGTRLHLEKPKLRHGGQRCHCSMAAARLRCAGGWRGGFRAGTGRFTKSAYFLARDVEARDLHPICAVIPSTFCNLVLHAFRSANLAIPDLSVVRKIGWALLWLNIVATSTRQINRLPSGERSNDGWCPQNLRSATVHVRERMTREFECKCQSGHD
jgi:hypothetical protein